MLNLSAVSGEHDLRGLRRLYNEVEANVWSLKALGVEQDSMETMLSSVLLMKLPLRLDWSWPEGHLVKTLSLTHCRQFLRRSSSPESILVIQHGTTVTPQTSLGHPRQPLLSSQKHKSQAEGPLLAAIASNHIPPFIATLSPILMLADRSWRPLEDASTVLWGDILGEDAAHLLNARLARENTIQVFVIRTLQLARGLAV